MEAGREAATERSTPGAAAGAAGDALGPRGGASPPGCFWRFSPIELPNPLCPAGSCPAFAPPLAPRPSLLVGHPHRVWPLLLAQPGVPDPWGPRGSQGDVGLVGAGDRSV